MSIESGEVYVPKERNKPPEHALIILNVDGKAFCYLDTRRDEESYYTDPGAFLATHQLATSDQLRPIIKSLENRQGALVQKISSLQTFAQTRPSCTEEKLEQLRQETNRGIINESENWEKHMETARKDYFQD